MKATPERAVELTEMTEAQGISQDRLFSRLQDVLRDMRKDHEALERLARHTTTMRAARLAAIVEARAMLPPKEAASLIPALFPMH